MGKVSFKYGTASQLTNAPYSEGTFYVISDSGSTDGILYADLNSKRICFGDVASLEDDVSELSSSIPTKISELVDDSDFIKQYYGTCGTAAATVQKEITINSITELTTGLTIFVKFTYANTAANPTLKLNNFDAKYIKRYGTTAPSTSAASSWNAGGIVSLTYDGTYWYLNDWNNTTYSAMSESEMQTGTATTARNITAARLKEAVEYHAPVSSVNGQTGAVSLTIPTVPTNVSDFTNDAGYLTSYTETDPTVPSWAKQSTKPTYTATEVGALPSTTAIPSKTSDLTNDSGYLTEETDPTVPSWAKASTKPSYNFSEIGSKPTTINGYGITDAYTKTQVDGLVAGVLHYKGTKAAISNLPTSGNTTGDTWHITADGSEWAWDGTTWQELGTAVDLSNYVTTNDSRLSDARTPTAHNQALSTITGADDLKAIEDLTGTSGLLKKTAANTWTLDTSNYLTSYTETDPVFSASAAADISSTDIGSWNRKSNLWTVSSDHSGDNYYWTLAISQNNLWQLSNAPGSKGGISYITLPVNRNGNVYSNVQLQLPITNGTIALTSDIPDTSSFLTSESDPVFSASAAANISSTDISNWNSKTSNTGTVTSVGLSNATDGGLTISGSPITDSGSITVGHSNVLSSAQTTQAVYPIKIDKNGHISAYGSAVTITDEKVKQIPLNGLNSGKGLLFSYSTGNSETTNTIYTSNKIMWNDYSPSLSIYNSDRSKYSILTYSNLSLSNSSTSYKGLLGTVNVTANRNYNLPDKSGTVALTSDIPSVYSSTNTGGYLTMDTLPIYDGTVV